MGAPKSRQKENSSSTKQSSERCNCGRGIRVSWRSVSGINLPLWGELKTIGTSHCASGTGRGCSVLEVVAAYARASGRPVPYQVMPRRPGDVAACWADASLARQMLGWQAQHGLDRMCQDSWRWQSMNPQGFNS